MNFSKWATDEEMKNNLEEINIKGEVKKSGIPIAYKGEKVFIDTSLTHNLIIGSVGSGKTQSLILPSLKLAIKAEESIVITDPKGELYSLMANKLNEEDYEVYAIDFDDPRYGNSWNPLSLAYIKYQDDKDKALELIENLGYYLFSDDKNSQTDPFWTNTTINFFTGLVLYLFENNKENDITLKKVGELANSINSKDKAIEFIEKIDKKSITYLKLTGTLNAPPETRGSILSVFNQKIEKYLSKENLSNMLSKNEIDFKNINNKKVAIFIVTGISTYYKNLIPLLADQIIEAVNLYGETKRRTNMLLDEFDSLVPIKDFALRLNYCRSINIRITVTIQSFIHLANIYNKEDVEVLKMCFGNTIYLLSEDITTLEEISNSCGNQLINGKEVPLIFVSELKTLPMFHAIVLMTRMLPYKTELLPDYKIDWGYETEKSEIPKRKK